METGLPAASYTFAGRVDGVSEAGVYGAPEWIRGAYNGDAEELGAVGFSGNLRELMDRMESALRSELANIAGE